MAKRLVLSGGVALMAGCLCSCQTTATKPRGDRIVVSVDDQQLVVMKGGQPLKSYPVSTSKFGLGSRSRSNHTPLGDMYVYQKIGGGARSGTVFKSRRPTGEVIRPNTPGRDPIVSRILWLEGKERTNANTKERCIYIHGTPEERNIGRPASYGCIRMTSRDVIDLYDRIGVGTTVEVKRRGLAASEIPGSDLMMVASRTAKTRAPSVNQGTRKPPERSQPTRRTISPPPGSGSVEVLAAAAPQRRPSPPATRTAPRREIRRAPAPTPKPATSQQPVRRRGAFTRVPDGSST